jgi:hypothetical protein
MQLTKAAAFSVGRKQITAIAAILALFANLSVHAQTPENAAVRKRVLEEAQTARASDDHQKALELASRAGRIQMTPSVRLFIAEEQTAVGQLTESWVNAQLCSKEAEEDQSLKNRMKIMAGCDELIDEIQSISARVIVSLPRPVPSGIQVTIRGKIVPESLLGQPYFVSPGKVIMDATAPNYLPFHRELVVRAGEEASVTMELAAQNQARAEVKPYTPAPPIAVAPGSQPSTLRKIAPYATMGLGVVSLGLSGLFLLDRNDADTKLQGMCTGPDHSVCPDTQQARSLIDTVSRDNALITATAVAGGAAIAGGFLWWLLDKPSSSPEPRLTDATITPLGRGAAFTLKGQF